MSRRLHLSARHRALLESILRDHMYGVEVWAYGSRVNDRSHDGSDLDLVLRGPGLEKIPLDRLMDFEDAVRESNIPFLVEARDWARLPEPFHREIEKEYVVLVGESGSTGESHVVSWLCDHADIVMGQSPPGVTCNTFGEGMPLLNGPTQFGPHHPTPAQFTVDPRKRATVGDLLFCVRGSTTGRMNWANRDYAIGRGVAAIRHRAGSQFQPLVRGVVEQSLPSLLVQATGSTFPNVSAKQLATIEWPNLGLREQRAIAHILGTLDDKIELNRRMNETLEAMARALFQSWFVDFDPVRAKMEGRDTGLPPDIAELFPDRLVDSELGEMPEGWEMSTLNDVIELHDRKRIPLNKRQRAERKGPYPYYGAAGIMDHVDGFLFDGVYVLTGEDGSVVDNHGHPVVQYVWGRFWVNNHAHVLKAMDEIGEEYLYLLLQQMNITAFVTGAVQPKLNQRNLKAIPLVRPSKSVCKAFSDGIAALFGRMRHNTDENRTLSAVRETLLPKLVSGELSASEVAL